MCTIIFAYKMHPAYDLIYLGNRDEFKNRSFTRGIFDTTLMGKDLEKGGTWFGYHESGRIAFLTNYRDFSKMKDRESSRGHLTTKYLEGKMNNLSFLEFLKSTRNSYNPYNIIYGTMKELIFYGSDSDTYQILEPGVYGLSNGDLDSPWPKVIEGKNRLVDLLYDEIIDIKGMFDILDNRALYDEDLLPHTIDDRELEKELSAMHVDFEGYGTVCKQVLLLDKKGRVNYYDKIIDDGFKEINHINFYIKK